jgi:hypothetical protein
MQLWLVLGCTILATFHIQKCKVLEFAFRASSPSHTLILEIALGKKYWSSEDYSTVSPMTLELLFSDHHHLFTVTCRSATGLVLAAGVDC